MQQNPMRFSFLINLLGLIYLLLISAFTVTFSSIFHLILVVLFLIGDIVFVLYIIDKPYIQIFTKISNWIYIFFIFFLNLFLILILIFRNSDEPLIMIINYFILIFGFVSILIVSFNKPEANLTNETEETTFKEKIFNLSSFLVMIALFVSPIITFIYLYALQYGSDEGITVFLFLVMMQLNLISFIPILGLSKRFKNKQISIMEFNTKFYKIIYFVLFISSLIVLISTVVPLIKGYSQDKIIAFNAVFYHVLFVGILTNLFYLLSILRQKR